jgi:hypothetical protein
LRGPWYVAHQTDGGTTMQVCKTRRVALKAAATLLQKGAAEVEVGPMLDTRQGVLRGDELRRVAAWHDRSRTDTASPFAQTTAAASRPADTTNPGRAEAGAEARRLARWPHE